MRFNIGSGISLHRRPTLEEIAVDKYQFQEELRQFLQSFREKPASELVRATVHAIQEKYSEYKSRVLEIALNHPSVLRRDRNTAPLEDFEKDGIKVLVHRITGGCVHTQEKTKQFDEIKAISEAVYQQPEFQNIRVGCLFRVLDEVTSRLGKSISLARTTFGKIIEGILPKTAKAYGRNSGRDWYALQEFIEKLVV